MQVTVGVGDGRAERPSNGWQDNSETSDSREATILNWNSTGRKLLTKVEQARGSSGGNHCGTIW